MQYVLWRRLAQGVGWGLLLALIFTFTSDTRPATAACGPNQQSDACSPNFGLAGGISAVSTDLTNPVRLHSSQLEVVGALTYSDYVAMENEARQLLESAMKFRQDISPYQGTNKFDELVRRFNIDTGFANTPYNGAAGDPDYPMTLKGQIDGADKNLRRARDLYAYLTIYAPAARMRAEYATTWCKNDGAPDASTGYEATIDWCDFSARLRQSAREAAYLRLIFAQEFMVDALGLRFGGQLLGGDTFVREEIKNLHEALAQYQQAERGLSEALNRPLGSGCYVADFYKQSEWALLSRAIQGQEEAQHHIAIRLSYLDIENDNDVSAAQAKATNAYRASISEGYIKLIGLSAAGPTSSQCAKGERPDSLAIAEMATNLLATRADAREMRENRNIFGFDVRLTPARAYSASPGTQQGLFQDADRAIANANTTEGKEQAATRTFDLDQAALGTAIVKVRENVDNELQSLTGCNPNVFTENINSYSCVETVIAALNTCDPLADLNDPSKEGLFDACIATINASALRQARQNLRVAALGIKLAQQKVNNLLQQAAAEELRNKQVQSAILGFGNGIAMQTFIATMANACTVTIGLSPAVTCNPLQGLAAHAQSTQILLEAARDAEITDANARVVIRNLLLDMAYAKIEQESAVAQYNVLLTEYENLVGQAQYDVFEAQRQRTYILNSPANDPSYRMVRDTLRLQLAGELKRAAHLTYLAARRAEYEHAARLQASGIRISDIYKARTADDMKVFLTTLDEKINNLSQTTNTRNVTLSVAKHVLGLTDAYLSGLGFTGDAIEVERQRRFHEWVAAHQRADANTGKPILEFTFATNIVPGGLLNQLISTNYDSYWLHKVQSLTMNLKTTQTGALDYREVSVVQSADVALKSLAGCIFDYRLIPPAALVKLDYPDNQPLDEVTSSFLSSVNNSALGNVSLDFGGRPIAANGWRVEIHSASPDNILLDLNLQQLTDIELRFSTTYASRAPGTPAPADCVRIDY